MKPLLVANWKMNFRVADAVRNFSSIQDGFKGSDVQGVVCAPFPFLSSLADKAGSSSVLGLGAQNCFYEKSGAYTGEVSCDMLRDFVSYVLVGHSERRTYFGETDEIVARKVEAALGAGLRPILCIGERPEDYMNDATFDVVRKQLSVGLSLVPKHRRSEVILAYEPLWAISTLTDNPVVPTEDEIVSMGLWLRKQLVTDWGVDVAGTVPILYGGSVNRQNVTTFVGDGKMDGALVGGASLKPVEFLAIREAIAQVF